MPTKAQSPRAAALRAQKLLNELREKGQLPPAHTKSASGGTTPAQRAAAHQGIGDDLRAAITDTHTDHMKVASSWVDHMAADMIVGDGNIEPELAFASVGELRAGGKLSNPHRLLAQTSELIRDSAETATLSHGADPAP